MYAYECSKRVQLDRAQKVEEEEKREETQQGESERHSRERARDKYD
jgi:hypothetical protein